MLFPLLSSLSHIGCDSLSPAARKVSGLILSNLGHLHQGQPTGPAGYKTPCSWAMQPSQTLVFQRDVYIRDAVFLLSDIPQTLSSPHLRELHGFEPEDIRATHSAFRKPSQDLTTYFLDAYWSRRYLVWMFRYDWSKCLCLF